MGQALAGALLAAGHPTTVWNRTPRRAEALVADGAVLAPGAGDVVAASPLVIVCVLDHDAVHAVLDPLVDALAGHAVVNLTSATPERARQTAAWAGDRGIDYLSGSVMVPTPMIGNADALILYSGSQRVFDEHRTTLTALAGDGDYLGSDAGLASAFDIAMLDLYFTGMTAFLHGRRWSALTESAPRPSCHTRSGSRRCSRTRWPHSPPTWTRANTPATKIASKWNSRQPITLWRPAQHAGSRRDFPN